MRTLSLSGEHLFHKFNNFFCSGELVNKFFFPSTLIIKCSDSGLPLFQSRNKRRCAFCLNTGRGSVDCISELVQTVAECIPTVLIARVAIATWRVDSFWSVARLINEGGAECDVRSHLLCKKWSAREQVALRGGNTRLARMSEHLG